MSLFVIQSYVWIIAFVSFVKYAILLKLLMLSIHYFILSITDDICLVNAGLGFCVFVFVFF